MRERGKRLTLVGEVISDKMEKTVVVEISRRVLHPVYKKYIVLKKKYHVHDERQECSLGDIVKIIASRPISKNKRWRVTEVVKKGESI